ncbi:hypothetical protein POSPLADRAFT_1051873 [Postia placenta MAD-698-R-SB12]|uniref:Uncharacterized protein n=1 Tax=Postia placenta MAD-698-R-SB12 TaxID=670580 RepID=A0A1X6NGJ1_9APHY|nr:hypothetical protein POSPLADRAFT_1051873 [Postia placenta MAD-698-R-SB12]OSX67747.1 hypothetical protein POSPLADRAFT_1051873 [Postia placenta MAD-698-R-SB12]
MSSVTGTARRICSCLTLARTAFAPIRNHVSRSLFPPLSPCHFAPVVNPDTLPISETPSYYPAFIVFVNVAAIAMQRTLPPKTTDWQDKSTFIRLAFKTGINTSSGQLAETFFGVGTASLKKLTRDDLVRYYWIVVFNNAELYGGCVLGEFRDRERRCAELRQISALE